MGDRFAELDRQLTEANLARARARYAYAATFTEITAREHDAAADEADRIGELYLRARFAHEADQAGLHVDPDGFEVGPS